MPLDFLSDVHPIHAAHHEEWARRERLLRGGVDVIGAELERFLWEKDDSHEARKRQAVYPGFGLAFARTLVGHVLKDRPEADDGLSFGAMGLVERGEGDKDPGQAEQVYFNVNGTGGDGQQFWQWAAGVFERAAATGLRWVLTEMPPGLPRYRSDELAGQRPYAVEFSPRVVTNWRFERGSLQWCVIRIRQDTRRVEAGRMQGAANEPGYYLLVRRGVTALGLEYAAGGWWRFDAEKSPIAENGSGTWEKTQGEIPMSLAVWEWESEPSGDEVLPLARSGTASLDNLSVAYMNSKSAWRSNMWRAAGGPTFLLGVDSESWKIAQEQWAGGSPLVGVPTARDAAPPSIAHSGAAAVAADAFRALLEDMATEAERMMIQQATSTPDSSGRSKEAGFAESKAPRLTMLAENMESFVNTLLRFFELRFGHASPGAYVQMPREFDLAPVEADVRDFFETFRLSELRSPTLEAGAMVRLAESKGFVNDENRETVEAELKESAERDATEAAQARQGSQEIRDALLRGRTNPDEREVA